MYSTITKYLHVLDIVIITKKCSRHVTYLFLDKSGPIKEEDELDRKFAGSVSSWPDGRTYKHIYYPMALQG